MAAIAVIGMGCVFPGAHNPEQLWFDVISGRRNFRRIPACRLPLDLYHDEDRAAEDKTYCKQAATIVDWDFDPLEFGVPPSLVEQVDRTHWLALSTASQALSNAQCEISGVLSERTAVVVGNTLGGELGRSVYLRQRWPHVERGIRQASEAEPSLISDLERFLASVKHSYVAGIPPTNEDTLAGTMSNTIAGRIASHFDLGGGAYSVDGACSSSLLAVAQGCDLITSGEASVVLAGAVDCSLDPYELIGFAKTHTLSPGAIRPFDERASGLLPGEGCGFVVLASEEMATSLGWSVHALIRGWGVSSDGKSPGITRPRPKGQRRALQRAYERAGYAPQTVGYFEAHGTATKVGDEVELMALMDLLSDTPAPTRAGVGSIKGNIGHCKAAAGIAGLIKAILALNHKTIPRTAGCEMPHHLFRSPDSPLFPTLENSAWPRRDWPRRAGVSAFGFGGSNAHITLEESPARADHAVHPVLSGAGQEAEVFLFSEDSSDSLQAAIHRVFKLALQISLAEMTDLAVDLAKRAKPARYRVAILASHPEQLHAITRDVVRELEKKTPVCRLGSAVVYANEVTSPPALGVVGLFPGQGSQHPGMEAALLSRFSVVRDLYAEIEEVLRATRGRGLLRLSAIDTSQADLRQSGTLRRRLQATEEAQPSIVACSLGYAAVMKSLGLVPDLLLGHSVGEFSALTVAGVLSPGEACRLAAERGRIIANSGTGEAGTMLAITASLEDTQTLLRDAHSSACVSALNGPLQTVISGSTDEILAMTRACERAQVRHRELDVSHAFHSPQMAHAQSAFRRVVDEVSFATPRLPLISPTFGRLLTRAEEIPELLTRQLTEPVRFHEAVSEASSRGPCLWVELGPGSALSVQTRDILDAAHEEGHEIAALAPAGKNPLEGLEALVARAFVLGFAVDPSLLYSERPHRCRSWEQAPRVFENPCEGTAQVKASSAASSPPEESEPSFQALQFIRLWVAKRMGYSVESISATSKLQDNLGLDSIKAMELLQALAHYLGKELAPGEGWMNIEIGELVQVAAGDAAPAHLAETSLVETGFAVTPLKVPGEGGDWIRSFQVKDEIAPLEREAPLLPPHRRLAVLALGEFTAAERLVEGLVAGGYHAVIGRGSLDGLESQRELGGVVVLLPTRQQEERSPWERAPEDLACLEAIARVCRAGVQGLFAMRTRPRVFVVQGSRGALESGLGSACVGLLRSVALEVPLLLCKFLDLPLQWDSEAISDCVLQELSVSGKRISYRYGIDGERSSPTFSVINASDPAGGLQLSSHDLVLATGGAQGITRELLRALHGRGARQLALMGRSDRSSPGLTEGLESLRQDGWKVRYYRCDVRDLGECAAALEAIRQEQGSVRVVLHGAGVTQPALLEKLDWGKFQACLATKVLGFANLLTTLDVAELKAVHFVSSVLGSSGMARQLDYAAANGWLDGLATQLKERSPHLHVLSLGYSVWRGAGIGQKLGSVPLLEGLGLTALSPTQGVDAYSRALEDGVEGRRIIMGRLLPELERQLFSSPMEEKSRFETRWLRWIPGVEAIASATLSLAGDPYLADHIYEGTPLLPAVVGIEAMVSVARACSGQRPLGSLHQVVFQTPITVPQDGTTEVRVCALVDSTGARVRCSLRLAADGFQSECFSAICVFDDLEVPPPDRVSLPSASSFEPLRAEHEARLFQGPCFRHIQGSFREGSGESEAFWTRLFVPRTAPFGRTATPFPHLRDAYLQSLLLAGDGPLLPLSMGQLRFFATPATGSAVYCRVQLKSREADGALANIDVFNEQGACLESIRDIRLGRIRSRP